MFSRVITYIFSALLVSAPASVWAQEALAAKKKPKKPKVVYADPREMSSVGVTYKYKKKNFSKAVMCYKNVPGDVKSTKKGMIFTSLDAQIKTLRKQSKNATKVSKLKLLMKAAKPQCLTPEHQSLDRYTGTFGASEARVLYDRFAFGGSPEEIGAAVGVGLDATVTNLTTYIADPNVEAAEAELRCDGKMATDPANEACDASDWDDVYFPGVRYGLYYRMWYSPSPFFEKFFMFLHDERMAASAAALSGCENHALLDHVALLRRAAISGDYVQFVRDFNTDHLGHFKWLSGGKNRGDSPNEDYGREILELGTVGASDLYGSPNYSNADIAQSALAFSGWIIQTVKRNDKNTCVPAYVPQLHAPQAKVVFDGTPYKATVYNDEDMLRAAFNHPRTAEGLAEDIWREFINPFPSPQSIQKLAAIIRENNYQLLPVFRRIMSSRAMFAERSRKSLIKHPVDLLLGFIRTTGIPVSYTSMDDMLSRMGEQPTLPPTVFGWNPNRLAGESFVLDWRNSVLGIMTQSSESMKKYNGFEFKPRFFTGLSGSAVASQEVINRVSDWLGVTLNAEGRAQLDYYLNYTLETCYNVNECAGQKTKYTRRVFDAALDGDGETKLRGLITVLATLPEYRMK